MQSEDPEPLCIIHARTSALGKCLSCRLFALLGAKTYVLDTAALYQPQKEEKPFVLVLANCVAPSHL